MKKLFAVLAAIFLLAIMACSGGGGSSSGNSNSTAKKPPETTINDYSAAIESGEVEKALEYVRPESKDRQRKILESALADPFYRQKFADAIKYANRVAENGNVIYFETNMETKDGEIVEDTFMLILDEDGVWKITGL